jgi:AbrB family looped-hinge helix DNA binding protein
VLRCRTVLPCCISCAARAQVAEIVAYSFPGELSVPSFEAGLGGGVLPNYGFIYGCINGRIAAMSSTIKMDESGRLVLPKALRNRLNLTSGTSLRVDVVAGRIELTPVESAGADVLGRKAGIVVLKRIGKKVDAAAAVAAERDAQEERGLRR